MCGSLSSKFVAKFICCSAAARIVLVETDCQRSSETDLARYLTAAAMETLTLRRLGGDPPMYEVPADAAKAVAEEVFQSDRFLRDDGTLRLSPANVFTAAEKALGRGAAVVIAGGDEADRTCTPGDASALADEFRAAGRSAAADAWEAKYGDGAFAAIWVARAQSAAPRMGYACCRVRARTLRVCEFDDDVSLARLEAALTGEGCREVLVVSTDDGTAAADVAGRCGASVSKILPASFGGGGPGAGISRSSLAERCGGDAAAETASGVGPVALKACAAILERLAATAPGARDFDLSLEDPTACLQLDAATLRALALVGDDSVLSLLRGHAVTSAGKKRLEAYVRRPLRDAATLKARQAAVAALVENQAARLGARQALKHRSCADADRLAASFARDVIPLRDLVAAHALRERLASCAAALSGDDLGAVAQAVGRAAKSLEKLSLLVEEVVDVDALPKLRVRTSLCSALAAVSSERDAAEDALQDAVETCEASLFPSQKKPAKRAKPQPKLKLELDDQRGHVLRVMKSGAATIRKAPGVTLLATRRGGEVLFTTKEVATYAAALRAASDACGAAQAEILRECSRVAGTFRAPLRSAARLVGDVDALQALAECAAQRDWARPMIDGTSLKIEGLRHPLVDEVETNYIPSDLKLGGDGAKNRCWLVTGPNMGGKSTFARAAALTCVLAHVGSFVPADSAEVPLLDRVFARVRSADDPRAGHSTFVREMRETAAILKNATAQSFVVVDEIGRGTSTSDGTSLAHAVCATLCRGPLSIFTTHFYALCALEEATAGAVRNHHVDALVEDENLTLLYKVQPGPATKSYGIHCARLAGFPVGVVADAARRLAALESEGA